MRGLYPIIDLESLQSRSLDVVQFTRELMMVRPPLVQLRAKTAFPREILSVLSEIRPICSNAGVQLFVNDRPDLAILAECEGVHVGQDDLTIEEVRRFAPRLKVGVSTHSLSQLDKALRQRPEYVAYGPVYPTSSKRNPEAVVGLEGLTQAAEMARAADCPLVAIGGVGFENASAVRKLAPLLASISALLPGPNEGLNSVSRRARKLQALLSVSE